MDIYINGTKIEFQLEKEKTVGEAVGFLCEWGQKQNYIFTGYSINGGSFRYGVDIGELEDLSLDEVQILEVTFQSTFDYAYESIRDIQFCIHQIYKKLLLDQQIEQVDTVVTWMRESLKKLLKIYNFQDEKCMETITSLGVLLIKRQKNLLEDQEKKSLFKICVESIYQVDRYKLSGYFYYLEELFLGERVEFNFLEKVLVLIDALRCELLGIGENIAKGNDKDAMLDLQNFMHGCSVLVLYNQRCKELQKKEELLDIFEKPLQSMLEILKKVEQSLKESDLVCVADSLEYEIYEYMQELLEKVGTVVVNKTFSFNF